MKCTITGPKRYSSDLWTSLASLCSPEKKSTRVRYNCPFCLFKMCIQFLFLLVSERRKRNFGRTKYTRYMVHNYSSIYSVVRCVRCVDVVSLPAPSSSTPSPHHGGWEGSSGVLQLEWSTEEKNGDQLDERTVV